MNIFNNDVTAIESPPLDNDEVTTEWSSFDDDHDGGMIGIVQGHCSYWLRAPTGDLFCV